MGLFSENKGEQVTIPTGKQLKCVVCAGDRFFERDALLNTRGMTFLKLDWANTKATCLVCVNCGYVHWFLAR